MVPEPSSVDYSSAAPAGCSNFHKSGPVSAGTCFLFRSTSQGAVLDLGRDTQGPGGAGSSLSAG
eukprot:7455995-Pyramimonas_sp.AAC.1